MQQAYNTTIAKQSLLLNNAGENNYNPLLLGLHLTLSIRFDNVSQSFTVKLDTNDPPITNLVFVQNDDDYLLYEHEFVAGTTPFIADTKLFYRAIFGLQTVWQRHLYIKSLPSDAVQVWDITLNEWVSVNFGTTPVIIPTVCQMCGIRFLNSWYDEFRINRYGGAKYVSIYDYGSQLGGSVHQEVIRQENKAIDNAKYIYLEKHFTATVETHDVTILLHTKENGEGVAIRIKVKTPSCLGFEIQDPKTTYVEINSVEFSGTEQIYNLTIKNGVKQFSSDLVYRVKRYTTQSAAVESGNYLATYQNTTQLQFATFEMSLSGWFEVTETDIAINNPRTYHETEYKTVEESVATHSTTISISYITLYRVAKTLQFFGELAWHASWKLLDGITMWIIHVDETSGCWVLSVSGPTSAIYIGPSSSGQPNGIYSKQTGDSLYSETAEVFGGVD